MDGIINFIESEGMQRVMMMYGVLIVFFGVIDFIEFKIKRKTVASLPTNYSKLYDDQSLRKFYALEASYSIIFGIALITVVSRQMIPQTITFVIWIGMVIVGLYIVKYNKERTLKKKNEDLDIK